MDMEHERTRFEIERRLAHTADARMGRIRSYDPKTHSVKVAVLPEADFPVHPEDVSETGWIPLAPLAVGNGWGIYAPPLLNTQVMLVHQEGDHGSPVAVVAVNDQNNVPPEVPAGEIWIQHQRGTTVRLTNDTNATLTVVGDLNITVQGNATITGQKDVTVTAQGNANLLSAARVNLGAIGGKRVARDGDPVSTGGVVRATSTTVLSA